MSTTAKTADTGVKDSPPKGKLSHLLGRLLRRLRNLDPRHRHEDSRRGRGVRYRPLPLYHGRESA